MGVVGLLRFCVLRVSERRCVGVAEAFSYKSVGSGELCDERAREWVVIGGQRWRYDVWLTTHIHTDGGTHYSVAVRTAPQKSSTVKNMHRIPCCPRYRYMTIHP